DSTLKLGTQTNPSTLKLLLVGVFCLVGFGLLFCFVFPLNNKKSNIHASHFFLAFTCVGFH
ncbi:hypothetical protein ACQP3F_31340, partial [Escherichia coli]